MADNIPYLWNWFRGLSDQLQSDLGQILVLIPLVLVGYTGLHRLIRHFTVLPETAYEGSSIAISFMTNVPSLLLLVLPSLFLMYGWGELEWSAFEYSRAFRWLIIIVAFPLVWTFVTYQFNFYFGQAHHFDRVLLLFLYALIWYHPVFIYPFLLLLFAIIGQFYYPFDSISMTDKRAPLNFLILFASYLFIRLRHATEVGGVLERVGLGWLHDREFRDELVFIWVVAGLIGGSYFVPGTAKIEMLWPFREALYNYIPIRWSWGWLAPLDYDVIMTLYELMRAFNPIGVAAALAIELAAIALMWRKQTFKLAISGFVVLHTVIFLATGLAFWKWVIMDVAFLMAVLLISKGNDIRVFDRRTAVIVTILILLAPHIYSISVLGWYTTNYDRSYTMEFVGEGDETVEMHRWHLEPYQISTAGQFDYLYNGTVLPSGTTTDYQFARAISSVNGPEGLAELKAERGVNNFDAEMANRFDVFIRRYVNANQEGTTRNFVWHQVSSPKHFTSMAPTPTLDQDVTYQYVRVSMTERLITGGELRTVNTELVRNVSLRGG